MILNKLTPFRFFLLKTRASIYPQSRGLLPIAVTIAAEQTPERICRHPLTLSVCTVTVSLALILHLDIDIINRQ